MQIIDGNWLRTQLEGTHGEQKKLAEAVGISPDKITKILKGERTIRPHEAPAFLVYFARKVTPQGLSEDPALFEGSIATPIEAPEHAAPILAQLAPSAHNPTIYKMNRDELGAALLQGDLLIVELGAKAQTGDLVLVTKNNTELDIQHTVLRRYLPPYLLPLSIGNSATPESASASLESAIVAVIKASARPGA